MYTFKQTSDIHQLPATHPAFSIVSKLIQLLIAEYESHGKEYDPENLGYIILLEPGDSTEALQQIHACWKTLEDIDFDGFSQINDEYIYGPYIGTDDYGLAWIIPAQLLPESLRSQVHGHLDL